MATTAGAQLAVLLAAQDEVSASVQLAAKPPTHLRLTVDGLGRIKLPISATQAGRLRGLGHPARYGRGEQTLIDPAVRDTWEIPAELVHTEWTGGPGHDSDSGPGHDSGHGPGLDPGSGLGPELGIIREELGLPDGCRLTAELHSLLVYDTGQFFLPHQDSQKDDTMIATLVVMLPSPHAGGELLVHHGGETTAYRGSTTDLRLVAFYADCRHEVRPVASGHRVVLTYDLLLRGAALHRATDEATVGEVAARLGEHFTTPIGRPYRGTPAQPPHRLAFLLDHEYTEHSLDWTQLKGPDSTRAALLRAAAQVAGCETVLALTEIQETWDAQEADPDRGYGRYSRANYRYWDDEDLDGDGTDSADPDPDEDRYVVSDLIDSSVQLTWWTEESAKSGEAISLALSDSEVCTATPSADLPPSSSQYEGYMGNWGNTLDRWYRRAAVLVWPRERGFLNRAEASPSRALDELATHLDDADAEPARTRAASLEPLWDSIVRRQARPGDLLAKALAAARAVDDPALAARLLNPFAVEQLRPARAAALASLAERYGDRWTADLLQTWFTDQHGRRGAHDPSRTSWLTGLPTLCDALTDTGDHGQATAHQLLEQAWTALTALIGPVAAAPPVTAAHPVIVMRSVAQRRRQLAELAEPLAAVLRATTTLQATALLTTIVRYCREHGEELGPCVTAALRTAVAATGTPPPQYAPIATDQADRLHAKLTRPVRSPDDWAIPLPTGCTCTLCTTLGNFLTDSAQRTLDWPLTQDRRSHIHSRIDQADLPVAHKTRRQGRPYVLVLTKTAQLFERETRQRAQDQADLLWLLDHWGQP